MRGLKSAFTTCETERQRRPLNEKYRNPLYLPKAVPLACVVTLDHKIIPELPEALASDGFPRLERLLITIEHETRPNRERVLPLIDSVKAQFSALIAQKKTTILAIPSRGFPTIFKQ